MARLVCKAGAAYGRVEATHHLLLLDPRFHSAQPKPRYSKNKLVPTLPRLSLLFEKALIEYKIRFQGAHTTVPAFQEPDTSRCVFVPPPSPPGGAGSASPPDAVNSALSQGQLGSTPAVLEFFYGSSDGILRVAKALLQEGSHRCAQLPGGIIARPACRVLLSAAATLHNRVNV